MSEEKQTNDKETNKADETVDAENNNPAETDDQVKPEVTAETSKEEKDSNKQEETLEENILEHDSIEVLQEKLEAALSKADENWDMALRAKAEMENLRRRTDKDIDNARKYGIEKIAKELLPVKDSMELGIKAAKEMQNNDTDSVKKIIDGIDMTMQQLDSAMDKVGIEEVAAEVGDAFNPEFHQAMSMLEMEDKKSNSIVSVFQKGYTLKNRLLRPAMVVVAK